MEEKESLFIRLLKKIGLIKEVEIDKNAMCKNAQSVCNHNCECCIWRE